MLLVSFAVMDFVKIHFDADFIVPNSELFPKFKASFLSSSLSFAPFNKVAFHDWSSFDTNLQSL